MAVISHVVPPGSPLGSHAILIGHNRVGGSAAPSIPRILKGSAPSGPACELRVYNPVPTLPCTPCSGLRWRPTLVIGWLAKLASTVLGWSPSMTTGRVRPAGGRRRRALAPARSSPGPVRLSCGRSRCQVALCAPVMRAARSSGCRNEGGGGGPQAYRPRAPSRSSGVHSWSSMMQSSEQPLPDYIAARYALHAALVGALEQHDHDRALSLITHWPELQPPDAPVAGAGAPGRAGPG